MVYKDIMKVLTTGRGHIASTTPLLDASAKEHNPVPFNFINYQYQ